MRKLLIEPDGWPCTLVECPPGPFINVESPDMLCFKSEYRNDDNKMMAYNSAGEFYHSDALVQPVRMTVVDEEV